jgi:hypothetical protein
MAQQSVVVILYIDRLFVNQHWELSFLRSSYLQTDVAWLKEQCYRSN